MYAYRENVAKAVLKADITEVWLLHATARTCSEASVRALERLRLPALCWSALANAAHSTAPPSHNSVLLAVLSMSPQIAVKHSVHLKVCSCLTPAASPPSISAVSKHDMQRYGLTLPQLLLCVCCAC